MSRRPHDLDPAELAAAVVTGDRRALARAITVVESSREADRGVAEALLAALPRDRRAPRVGVTGLAGAGKSTLIDAVGCGLVDAGVSVAVLAVDPISPRAGGSLLGDKTRMAGLASRAGAYVRPSPAGRGAGSLGGATEDAATLCEAAGYQLVFVETVGAGQSEWEVATLVDYVLLLLLPGAGDEVQGIKRGVLELSDMVVVTHADGDAVERARATRDQYAGALALLCNPAPEVLEASVPAGVGVQHIVDRLTSLRAQLTPELEQRRARQRVSWFRHLIRRQLFEKLLSRDAFAQRLAELESDVLSGRASARGAARVLVDLVVGE